jgi:mono/diheme cytochrome c family protein
MMTRIGGLRLGMVVAGTMLTLAVAASPQSPRVLAPTPEAAGRYLVVVGGCNDCHTPGWAEGNGDVPESEWLVGSSVGFKGPWGTSYPANLRLTAQTLTEDAFVARARAGAGLPPMPWMNLSRMADEDLRSVYAFLRSLGPAGERAPAAVAPGVEPSTPYFPFEPVMPQAASR